MEYIPQEGVDYLIDLYALLGVGIDTEETDIQKALEFKRLQEQFEVAVPRSEEQVAHTARLLTRARIILLNPDKRADYNGILNGWVGAISTDGTPLLSEERQTELRLEGMTATAVEAMVTKGMTNSCLEGYDPDSFARLEARMYKDELVTEALRAEYEEALLQKDRVLALEQAERSVLLGLPDIEHLEDEGDESFVTTLDYARYIAGKLAMAKEVRHEQLRFRAFGGVAVALARLAGEIELEADVAPDSPPDVRLPAYFDDQARKIQAIAEERGRIIKKRLNNLTPVYPEAALQTTFRENLLVGMVPIVPAERLEFGVSGQLEGIVWYGERVSQEDGSVETLHISREMRKALAAEDYRTLIEDEDCNIVLISLLEQTAVSDLNATAIKKYLEKYRR